MKSSGQGNRDLALSVMDDQGRSEAAVECLRKACSWHPTTSMRCLIWAVAATEKRICRSGRLYWRWYLAGDRLSEWAARALKFCELQINSLTYLSSSQADSDQAGLAFCRLAGRRFLLPAIRKIIPRTPVVGRRININWLSDRWPANSVAFGGHALGINGVVSHLQ